MLWVDKMETRALRSRFQRAVPDDYLACENDSQLGLPWFEHWSLRKVSTFSLALRLRRGLVSVRSRLTRRLMAFSFRWRARCFCPTTIAFWRSRVILRSIVVTVMAMARVIAPLVRVRIRV
jgi:hypothetical protein